MPAKVKIFEDVLIIDTGHKGAAIGKTPDGRIVAVENAIPGDRVAVIAGRKRNGMFQCKVKEYTSLSPHRTEPSCGHFGVCGGCKWQHMQYSAQLQFKEKSVRDALERIAQLQSPLVHPILGCAQPFHYRNKMEYTFTDRRWLTDADMQTEHHGHRNGLGLHVSGAFAHVTDIQQCWLQPETANAIRNFVRDTAIRYEMPFQNVRFHKGFLRNLILRNNLQGQWMVTVVFGEDQPAMREILLSSLQKAFPEITSLYYCINHKPNDSTFDLDFIHFSGETFLPMQLGHIEYRLGPKSFFQTNSKQAESMCKVVHQLAGLTGSEFVYDLYSGIGSFALYLARNARQVIGIEEIREAVLDAEKNALHNGVSNVKFFAGDVKKLILQPEIKAFGIPDVIITDPPRAGMDASVVESLLAFGPRKIVYISCNPSTQARDLTLLAPHYEHVQSQPIDMFPQTAHVENVALLHRRS